MYSTTTHNSWRQLSLRQLSQLLILTKNNVALEKSSIIPSWSLLSAIRRLVSQPITSIGISLQVSQLEVFEVPPVGVSYEYVYTELEKNDAYMNLSTFSYID